MRIRDICLLILSVLSGTVLFAGSVPPEATKIINDYQAFEKKVLAEAEAKLKPQRDKMFADLQALQDSLTKQGNLDAAVTVRNKAKELSIAQKAKDLEIRGDPGNLSSFANAAVGTVLYFRLTGATSGGSVWGTGLYTMDSKLSMAAVHSGALNAGAEGIVKVTIAPGQQKYGGSMKNGVTSSDWGSYSRSYKVEVLE